MKYLPSALLMVALSGCAEHHELTSCKGPYSAISPPAPLVEAPKAAPAPPPLKPIVKQQPAVSQGGPM